MLDAAIRYKLIEDVFTFIVDNKEKLFIMNRLCTQDTDYWIENDFQFVCSCLKYYRENDQIFNGKFKPKGSIMIITSYNEPLILSVIPIINAIIAGNKVTCKPSKRALDIINFIWVNSGIKKRYHLDLDIITLSNNDDLVNIVKSVVAVYFFGGIDVAKKIAKVCADNFVEFRPEIEAADCMIVKYKNKIPDKRLIESILEQSFTHAGQSCQRIQGAYVDYNNYENFQKLLKDGLRDFFINKKINKHIRPGYVVDHCQYKKLMDDIRESAPGEVFKMESDLPILVLRPDANSEFINNAYFLPVFWVKTFKTDEDLIKLINSRRFFLGLNIMSDDDVFLREVIDKTSYSRYTINMVHINIGSSEGWGGMWPTGYLGYQSWILHFVNTYAIIEQ